MPSTATTASSPGPKCPDAFDVPVRITSPGSNVANDEIAAICSGMPWIMFAVGAGCHRHGLTVQRERNLGTSPVEAVGPMTEVDGLEKITMSSP